MSVYRYPIAIFGAVFPNREAAVVFCEDKYENDELVRDELGLEYFEYDDEYILGYLIDPGVSDEKCRDLWKKSFGALSPEPASMLRIRQH